jgi:hypothetical protein
MKTFHLNPFQEYFFSYIADIHIIVNFWLSEKCQEQFNILEIQNCKGAQVNDE